MISFFDMPSFVRRSTKPRTYASSSGSTDLWLSAHLARRADYCAPSHRAPLVGPTMEEGWPRGRPGTVMALLFVLSWLAQSIAGTAAYNEQQLRELLPPVSWGGYLASADFWNRSLQNWQSELLAVAAMAITSPSTCVSAGPRNPNPSAPRHTSTGVEG